MPLKAGKEQQNIDEALREMVEIVGDDRFDDHLFESSDVRFEEILPTTWELLERKNGWLEQLRVGEYRLTASGWVEALKAAGILCDTKMKVALGKMCAPIKARCESGSGRHQDSITVQEIAGETGLLEAFIYNAVEAHLIRICLQKQDCEWEPGDQNKNYIMIPVRFGQPL